MSDNDRKDLPPGDPWARWRKPAETAAVDVEKTAKTVAPATPVETGAAAEAAAPAEPAAAAVAKPATGTLSPRKVVKPAAPERKKAAGRPSAGKRDERPYAGKREETREGRPAAKAWEKSGERKDARGAGKADARPGQRAENPWSKTSERKDAKAWEKPAERQGENPWAKAAGDRAARPAEKPVANAVPVQAAAVVPAGEAPSGVRLSKVMSERGLCSRREADLWIERGWVFVDGEQISELGSRIDPAAEITVSKEAVKDQAKAVTILLHKPVGYVSGQPEPGCTPAVTLITPETQVAQSGDPEFKPWMLRGLAPAGRLDVDSTGLLVLTSDGRVAKRLIGENSDAEKEYLVRVSGQLIENGLELLRHGLELDGKPLKPAWIKQLNEDQLHFILKEGKKRQIRRMCELVGLRVIGLKRVRIGRIRLGDLPLGMWRFLRADEGF